MKILSRNIGGGHFFNLEKLPDKESREDISMIIDYIKNANADIVLLQEMHLEDTGEIPNRDFWNSLGYRYISKEVFHPSHIDSKFSLGIMTLSRYPIIHESINYFPKFDAKSINLTKNNYVYYKKGLLETTIKINPTVDIIVSNVHTTPFHIFGRDYGDPILHDHVMKIDDIFSNYSSKFSIIAGDFNYGNLEVLFKKTFSNGMKEAFLDQKTNMRDEVQKDHILTGDKINIIDYKIDTNIRTDHYPIVLNFSL